MKQSKDNKKLNYFRFAFLGFFLPFLFLSLFYVFAENRTFPYNPGDTLDPECNPGEENCTVALPVNNFTSGSVLFSNTDGTITEDNSNFFWDNTNKRLGIGTKTPSQTLHVLGDTLLEGNIYAKGDIYTDRWLNSETNTAIGIGVFGAGNLLHTDEDEGYYNTVIGYNSLFSNTTGSGNLALGTFSLYSNTTGYNNTAIGSYSLRSNTTGYYNVAIGHNSLYYNETGENNTAIGSYSLYKNTTGYYNIAIGIGSLFSNVNGSQNVAIGHNSLYYNETGENNTAIGSYSLRSNTTGYNNTAIGSYSLYYNTTGNSNTAIGNNSLFSNTTGYSNTAMGNYSLSSNTTGLGNIAIGNFAGKYATGSNELYIDNRDRESNNDEKSNSLIYGIFGNTPADQTIRFNTQTFIVSGLGVGSGTQLYIDSEGKVFKGASSLKYKENVRDLEDDFLKILSISPKTFTYKNSNIEDIGYIAEDFDKLGLNKLVMYDKEGKPDAIKYDRIVLYLTEVLKLQQKDIEEIKLNQKKQVNDELQMTDKATGKQYCVWIENGEWKKAEGNCNELENKKNQLSSNNIVSSNSSSGSESNSNSNQNSTPTPTPTPTFTPTSTPTLTPETTPLSIPEPSPEITSTPTLQPIPESEPETTPESSESLQDSNQDSNTESTEDSSDSSSDS
ncbi:MAG TPA: tail fiber domain-containing protein [Candidatus Pacearchaeota archaeon]|nr:tail fiber domain-containing protein [Candidatus Pacearchaeota archaeon]